MNPKLFVRRQIMSNPFLSIEQLDQVNGGRTMRKDVAPSAPVVAPEQIPVFTCPECQCPNLKWNGRHYQCPECFYQGVF